MKRHILIGAGAAVLLIAIYVSIIGLVQDWSHALDQTARLWYWVVLLAGGFGVQAGLFSFIRHSFRQRRATASVVASGGVSAGSMAACCAHHLADVLPLLGLSGLAAFLVNYQVFFVVVGVVSNFIGMTIMLETIQRHHLSTRMENWRLNMRWAKRGMMAAAPFILAIAFFAIP